MEMPVGGPDLVACITAIVSVILGYLFGKKGNT